MQYTVLLKREYMLTERAELLVCCGMDVPNDCTVGVLFSFPGGIDANPLSVGCTGTRRYSSWPLAITQLRNYAINVKL